VTTPFGAGLGPGPARIVVPVEGVDDRVAITATSALDLVRITGFEPLADLALPTRDGPARFDTATFCPPR
jgi:hypothetical protein